MPGDKLIPSVQVPSGEKFVNEKGVRAIKDGIKASQSDSARLAKTCPRPCIPPAKKIELNCFPALVSRQTPGLKEEHSQGIGQAVGEHFGQAIGI